MTLQRIVGAGVLSFIFMIVAVLLLYQGQDDTAQNTTTDDDLILMDIVPEAAVTALETDELLSDEIPLGALSSEASNTNSETMSSPVIEPPVEDNTPLVLEKPAAELTVPKPNVIETPKDKWFLQIASFSHQENAKQLILDLKQKGIEAKADMVIGQKGQIYRVRTIPQSSKDKTEQAAEKIKQYFDITPQLLHRKIK